MADWFTDDSFWAATYAFELRYAKPDTGDAEIEGVLRLSGTQRGDVLDLACGVGRHAIALARRGFRVTAVDLSAFHLAKAMERAAAADASIEFIASDMRSFIRPNAFDLVVSLFSSFGYFEDPQDDLQLLRNMHQSLKPGGSLVMDLVSKERLARTFQPTLSETAPDGSLRVRRHRIVDDWTRVWNEWIIIKDGVIRTFEFTLRVYSGQEFKDLLCAAGFTDIKLHGGFDGRPYDLDAERLVSVSSKSGVASG